MQTKSWFISSNQETNPANSTAPGACMELRLQGVQLVTNKTTRTFICTLEEINESKLQK